MIMSNFVHKPSAAHEAANHRGSLKTRHGQSNLIRFLSVGCLLLTAGLAVADSQPDLSTPLAAAKSYYTAMRTGDAKVMGSASIGTNYQKEWMVQLMRSCLAYEKLDKAAAAKFGREQTDKIFDETKRSSSLVAVTLAALTNGEVKIDGTNATITFKLSGKGDTPDPVKLQQAGREWKVVLGSDIDKADFNAALMEATAKSEEQCAADITAGKYKTAEEAQQGMMSAMMALYQKSQQQQRP